MGQVRPSWAGKVPKQAPEQIRALADGQGPPGPLLVGLGPPVTAGGPPSIKVYKDR
jgi:hypothetical protein